jgi:hypothetical protein
MLPSCPRPCCLVDALLSEGRLEPERMPGNDERCAKDGRVAGRPEPGRVGRLATAAREPRLAELGRDREPGNRVLDPGRADGPMDGRPTLREPADRFTLEMDGRDGRAPPGRAPPGRLRFILGAERGIFGADRDARDGPPPCPSEGRDPLRPRACAASGSRETSRKDEAAISDRI